MVTHSKLSDLTPHRRPASCPECRAPKDRIWFHRTTGQLLCTNCGADVSPVPTNLTFLPASEDPNPEEL